MAIEIVDLPIKNGGSFHSFLYVYQAGYLTSPNILLESCRCHPGLPNPNRARRAPATKSVAWPAPGGPGGPCGKWVS